MPSRPSLSCMTRQRFPRPIPDAPGLLLGIIGHPLGHSLSPALHNWAMAELGVSGVYCRWPQPPESLEAMLQAVRTLPIHGLSVTIPHKEAIIPLLDRITPAAQAVGAVNTVYWEGDQLCGDNTDVPGFLAPLKELEGRDSPPSSALVMGAGGAARAVLAGLRDWGAPRVGVCNRNPERSQALAEAFHVEQVAIEDRVAFGATLVINATPLGMAGRHVDQSPWPEDGYDGMEIAYDLVYNPLRTRFLRDARHAGVLAVDGLGMFLGQAQCQFRRWTGLEFPWEPAKALLLEALRHQG